MTLNDLIVEVLADRDVQAWLKIFAANPTHIAETELANAMREVIIRPRPLAIQ